MLRHVSLLLLSFSTPAAADQTVFGLTRNGVEFVCADLNEVGATPSDRVGSWILGFWSGMNAARNSLVGDSTTANGILGEIKLYCSNHPSTGLAQAAFDTYAAMRKEAKK